MPFRLTFLAITFLALGWLPRASFARPADQEPLPVVVFAGQSNMVGRNTTKKGLPSRDGSAVSGCFQFDAGEWKAYSEGKTIGPEAGFVRQYKRITGRSIGVLKLAKGGSSLAKDWNPKRGGGLFDKLADRVKAAGKQREIEVIAILWMQGEADADSKSDARAYQKNLAAFLRASRKEFGAAKSTPFVAGRINPPKAKYAHRALVREGIETCRDKSFAWIDCDDLRLQEDNLHLTSVAAVELGRRMADEVCYLRSEGALGKKSSVTLGEPLAYLFVNLDGLLRHRPRAIADVPGLEAALERAREARTMKELGIALEPAIELVAEAPRTTHANRASLADVAAVLDALSRGKWDLSELPVHLRVVQEESGKEPELRGLPGVRYRK